MTRLSTHPFRLDRLLAAAAMAGCFTAAASAQQRIWDGGGATDNWSEDANWNNASVGLTGNVWAFSTTGGAAATQRTTDMDLSYNLERTEFYTYTDWQVNSSNGSTLSLRGGGSAFPQAIFVGTATTPAAVEFNVPIVLVARASPDPNPKTFDVRAGGSLTFNNSITSGSYHIQKAGPGDITFNAASPLLANEYRIANGTTLLGNNNALGAATIVKVGGNNIRIASATNTLFTLPNDITHSGAGGMSFSQTGGPDAVLEGDITLAALSNTFGGGDDVAVTVNGDITGNGADSIFSKATGATYILNGNVTGAALNLGNGTLVLNGNQAGVPTTGATPLNTVVSGGTLEINGQHAGNVGVGAGTLRGAGSVRVLSLFDGNPADAFAGGTLSPGDNATADTLTAGRADFADGGGYLFNLNDTATGAGAGWDLLTLSGADGTNGVLDVTAGSGGFLIDIDGAGSGFDATQAYSFLIVDAAGVTGFAPSDFTVDTTGFTPDLMGGAFSLSDAGGDLSLVFTPVPEPASVALLAAATLTLLPRRRQHS